MQPPKQQSKRSTRPPFEIIECEKSEVWCDGGGGPLGHPRVFLHLDVTDEVVCPYCSRLYRLRRGARASDGH